jgi:hypothetical protein
MGTLARGFRRVLRTREMGRSVGASIGILDEWVVDG